ncbi:MAG: formyltransferase family protein [Candidatus Portnoybacteria bacterium]
MDKDYKKKKKVIVLGKGILAIKVADWLRKSKEYELVFIVPVIPEPTWTESFLGWGKNCKVPMVESGHYQDLPQVKEPSWKIDLAISVFYDKIIKDWFIPKCSKIINIHNSPLPRYRGVAPINWALKNGEKEHGITIHEIIPQTDAGPIMSQLKYSIYPEFDEVKDVYQRALEYAFVLFKETMPLLEKITPSPQEDSLATYYSEEDSAKLGERKDFTKKLSQRKLD